MQLYFRFVKRPGESHLALDGKNLSLSVHLVSYGVERLIFLQRTPNIVSETANDPVSCAVPSPFQFLVSQCKHFQHCY